MQMYRGSMGHLTENYIMALIKALMEYKNISMNIYYGRVLERVYFCDCTNGDAWLLMNNFLLQIPIKEPFVMLVR
jgi:hypothetical protein